MIVRNVDIYLNKKKSEILEKDLLFHEFVVVGSEVKAIVEYEDGSIVLFDINRIKLQHYK